MDYAIRDFHIAIVVFLGHEDADSLVLEVITEAVAVPFVGFGFMEVHEVLEGGVADEERAGERRSLTLVTRTGSEAAAVVLGAFFAAMRSDSGLFEPLVDESESFAVSHFFAPLKCW